MGKNQRIKEHFLAATGFISHSLSPDSQAIKLHFGRAEYKWVSGANQYRYSGRYKINIFACIG